MHSVQECASIEDKSEFYSVLEEEIVLTVDANEKLGNQIIKEAPHEMSSNGRLLFSLVERLNLVIVNSTMKCHGTITRMKKVSLTTL